MELDNSHSRPLSETWKDRLDLTNRGVPELYEDIADATRCPYASAIRLTLDDLGASAVFCVQEVPTVVILIAEEYERNIVSAIHGALWNQGLASLLLLIVGDVVRVFSLNKTVINDEQDFDERCLVMQLDAVAETMALKDVIYGAESGRLWEDFPEYFDSSERVDQVLLENLMDTHEELCNDGLSTEASQALLIQTMFIAYLEDRGILQPEYFSLVTDGSAESFSGLLESRKVSQFYRLFRQLYGDFNGDLFVAPCAFDLKSSRPRVTSSHMETIATFRSGRTLMGRGGGQLQFWSYNFKYIPIELISAVYDRFLGLQKSERRSRGAYYTPMFLADTVMTSVWDTLSENVKEHGSFMDPACGSGIFMVKCFQQLCEHWRASRRMSNIRWDSLCKLLGRLRGFDINGGAVRVAVFSLYIALLQEVKPPDIRRLIGRGRLLPVLWGTRLLAKDFFNVEFDRFRADVVMGNPPWTSRRDLNRTSVSWCRERELPMPGNEEAWAFVWKSLQHLKRSGVVGFLVPAMGFLHNHSTPAVDARRRLFRVSRVIRIVNFADLRFQLFQGAVRPAALAVIGVSTCDASGYRFDYWVPKASRQLKARRTITLGTADKGTITSNDVEDDPAVFRHRLWMNKAEAKLFKYLSRMRKIGDFVEVYSARINRRKTLSNQWVVGQGFKPANVERLDDERYYRRHSELVASIPYMPIDAFRELAQGPGQKSRFIGGLVHSRGFERGFDGPRILVPRGIVMAQGRLRASYAEHPLTFQDIIQAITIPREDVRRGKLLTALLNSKLLLWFAFHGTSSLGADRPELQQAELLRLPFPMPHEMQDPEQSESVANALISLVDDAITKAAKESLLSHGVTHVSEELDLLCYEYFGLGTEEITLVEDTVRHVIPNVQPHSGSSSDLWVNASKNDREAYATELAGSLSSWFESNVTITAELEAKNDDLALLHLRISDDGVGREYRETHSRAIGDALGRLGEQLNVPLPGNFQLVPDFRMFDGKSLFLVKPLQRRFWLRSTAIADADGLAVELQHAQYLGREGRLN